MGKDSKSDVKRVLRGGSWNNNGRNCRSAIRNRYDASNRNNNIGFRIALAQCRIGITANDQSFILFCSTTNKKQGCPQASSEVESLWDDRSKVSLCPH